MGVANVQRGKETGRGSHASVHRIEVAVLCQQSDYFGRKSVIYVLNPLSSSTYVVFTADSISQENR